MVDSVYKIFGDNSGVKALCILMTFISLYEKWKSIQNSNYKSEIEQQMLQVRESNLAMQESNLNLRQTITKYLSPETIVIEIKKLILVYEDLSKDNFFLEVKKLFYKE